MRLWSLHPRQLDGRGLVTLWREGMLARGVLLGRTRGYRHHPQLERFRAKRDPVAAVDGYLSRVLDEATSRGYRFDASKIRYRRRGRATITVTTGQLRFEWRHLLGKLARRDRGRWVETRRLGPQPHPSFRVIEGPVADWERRPAAVRRARTVQHHRGAPAQTSRQAGRCGSVPSARLHPRARATQRP